MREIHKENIRREIKQSISKSPLEANPSSMTTPKTPFKIFWRPNNYRRKIKIKIHPNSTPKSTIDSTKELQTNYSKHSKLLFVKYKGITIQYGKETLIGIYSQAKVGGVKEVYLIEANSIDDLEERIKQKKDEIEKKIDTALFSFAKKYKIFVPFTKPEWVRYEDFIKGEDFIDSIPPEVIIHDTFFKKVYGKGIEFGKKDAEPTVHLKNYIKNRAIEDVAPEIVNSINNLSKLINPYKTLIKSLKKMDDIFTPENKDLIESLSFVQKEELGNWIIHKFGVII